MSIAALAPQVRTSTPTQITAERASTPDKSAGMRTVLNFTGIAIGLAGLTSFVSGTVRGHGGALVGGGVMCTAALAAILGATYLPK